MKTWLSLSATSIALAATLINPRPAFAQVSVSQIPGANVPHLNLRYDCGAFLDGVHDDTPAFNVCKAKAQSLGAAVIDIPRGGVRYTNLVMDQNGLDINDEGWGYGTDKNAPTSGYWKAFDPTKPVITIAPANATQLYSGMHIGHLMINCEANSAQVGILVNLGSYKNRVDNYEIMGCTDAGVRFQGQTASSTATVASAKNIFSNGHIAYGYNKVGAMGADFTDPLTTGTVFNNDQLFVGLTMTGSNGGIALHNDSSQAHFIGLKVDTGGQGAMVFEKHGITPNFYFSPGSFDSGNSTDTLVVLKNFNDPATSLAANPVIGGISVDGSALNVTNVTTGTYASDSTSLSVADGSGLAAGKKVLVRVNGSPLIASVVSSAGCVAGSSCVVTLDTTTHNPGSNVEVDIGYDTQGIRGVNNPSSTLSGGSLQLDDQYTKGYAQFGFQPALHSFHSLGNAYPYNASGWAFEMGSRPLDILSENVSNANVASVTSSGTNVTLSSAVSHGASVGDLIVVRGFNESGYNGTFTVQTVPTSTTLTYTATVTPSATTGTGSGKFWSVKDTNFSQGYIGISSGLRINYNGSYNTILSTANSGQGLLFTTPGGPSGIGVYSFVTPSGLSSSTADSWHFGNTSYQYYVGGNSSGCEHIGLTLCSFLKPALSMDDATTDDTGTLGSVVHIWNNGGVLRHRTGTLTSNFVLSSTSAATVSGGTLTTGSNAARGEVSQTAANTTTVSISFTTAYPSSPICSVSSEAGKPPAFAQSVSGLTLTTASAAAAADKYTYHCEP